MNAAQSSTKKPKKKSAPSQENKCITFAVGGQTLSLELTRMREIVGYIDITPVQNPPANVLGVIRVLGQFVSVIDLAGKLGKNADAMTDDTCILVVELSRGGEKSIVGLIVDRVISVDPVSSEIQQRLLDVDAVIGGEELQVALPRAA